jgi:mannose-1-phosphate guanylyltransferase
MATLLRQQIRQASKSAASRGQNRWAIILAGGDGTRLRSFTRTITGDERPKQFCPIIGGRTLLEQTLERVYLSVPIHQTLLVLTESHERFYKKSIATLHRHQLLVQPENKGTAPAILYGLLQVASLSRDATVAVFPSDHYLFNDERFMSFVNSAFDAITLRPDAVTLLGITPEAPEVEYGWIEPATSMLGTLPGSITRVRRFWEKPTLNVALRLMERGCLWNSFVMIGRVESFLKVISRALPELFELFVETTSAPDGSGEVDDLRSLYARIAETNFSHEVLARRPDDLTVMKVDKVGWNDLGEPSRVLATLARLGVDVAASASAS